MNITTKTALEALTKYILLRAFDTAAQNAAKLQSKHLPETISWKPWPERAWEFAGDVNAQIWPDTLGNTFEKLDQFRTDYKAMIETAPKFIFYKMKTDDPYSIDMNSVVTWRTEQIPNELRVLEDPDKVKEAAKENCGLWICYRLGANYEWKKGVADTSKTTNDLNLEYVDDISSGLNATIKNRHLLPIGFQNYLGCQRLHRELL